METNVFSNRVKTLNVFSNSSSLLSDKDFKVIFSEPVVALNFLRIIAPDIVGDSLEKLRENLISYDFLGVNRLQFSNLTKELIETTREMLTRSGKLFIPDIVFELKYGEKAQDLYTINIEMQQKDKNYDMLSRAMYYAMSMVTETLRNGSDYDKLHKIYSFWFLDFNYFNDDIVVHSVSPRAYYNLESENITTDTSKQSNAEFVLGADLIEVVFVELRKRNNVRSCLELKELLNTVCKLDTDPVQSMKKLFHISEKEVEDMIMTNSIFDDLKEEGRGEGREEGREEGIFALISALEDLNIEEEIILQKLSEKFLLTGEEARDYYDKYQMKKIED